MDIDKTYVGTSESQIWEQIANDINDDTLEYHAIIKQSDDDIYLDIEIDLGGGFEGGYATTSYRAPIINATDFKFAVHEEHFTDEIGKFFGMQDIETGYPDLDDHLIIKTNNDEKVRSLFADDDVRRIFVALENFDLGIHRYDVEGTDEKQAFLELNIEDGVTDIATLHQLYHAFYVVLKSI